MARRFKKDYAMASKYNYKTHHAATCCVQKDGQNGKYFICVGGAMYGRFFYDTAEEAQRALDMTAAAHSWHHDDTQQGRN